MAALTQNRTASDTPAGFRAVNRVLAPVARRLWRLDPDGLMATASRRNQLDNFGAEDFVERLAVLCRALDREAFLHPIGRYSAHHQLVGLLATRLRLAALIEREPDLLDLPLTAPIVIVGMPRTGTTHLQRLLARDGRLRSLPYWEAIEPIPAGATAGSPWPDPVRVRRARLGLGVVRWAAPEIIAMHEMDAELADEEIWLLAADFATMLFEASYNVPSYRDWYDRADHTHSYQYLRTLLQALSWLRGSAGGERWLLKSPQHLATLGPLLSAFPDATVVQMHRDPVKVTASMASMAAYGRRVNSEMADPVAIGRYWADRVEHMLRRSMLDRPPGDTRFVDVRFAELMSEPLDVVEQVYGHAGIHLTDQAREAMRARLEANPRAKHGMHHYELADYGLDADERRRAFADYQTRFGVPAET